MSDTLTDICGHTIRAGDPVVYPQMSGRSVQIVRGIFLGLVNGKAKIQRVEGARWEPEFRSSRYIDTRTGKGIRIYTAGWPHHEVPPREYFVHIATGEEITCEEYDKLPFWGTGRADRQKWKRNWNEGVLKGYVGTEREPFRPVVVTNITNIVKVFPQEES